MSNETFKILHPQTQEVVDLMQLTKDETKVMLQVIELRGLLIIHDLLINRAPKSEQTILILALVNEIIHFKYSINSFLRLKPNNEIINIDFICPDPNECID